MAEESFNLSYIVSFLADYLDDDAGVSNHGPNVYIDTTPLLQESNYGPNYWISTPGDLLLNDNYGPHYSISTSGILVGVVFGDLIHYGDQAAFQGNVGLSDGVNVRAANTGTIWQRAGQSVVVNNCVENTALDEFDSGSVNTNTGTSQMTEMILPPASTRKGLNYIFVNTTTSGSIQVSPTGLDTIIAPNGSTSSGIFLNSFGAKIRLVSDGGSWLSQVEFGTIQLSGVLQPDSIPGLALWLDASDASTISTGIFPDVSLWRDKSGSGNDVSQSTNSFKPHTGFSINGLNAIAFDGINQFMINNTGVPSGTFVGNIGEFFAVFEQDSIAGEQTIFTSAKPDATSLVQIKSVSVAGNDPGIRQVSTSGGPPFGNAVRGNSIFATGVALLVNWRSDGNEYFMRVNSIEQNVVTQGLPSNSGDWFADTFEREFFTVGALFNDPSPQSEFIGRLGELIYYDGVNLTSNQRGCLEQGLKNKWSIQGEPFSPANLPNLLLWLDASDSSTITQDANGVNQWADKSNAGIVSGVAQNANIFKPTVSSGSVNGLDAILFDDANAENLFVFTTGLIQGAPFTIIAVGVPDDAANNNTIYWAGESGNNNSSYLMRFQGATAGDPVFAGVNESAVIFEALFTTTGFTAGQAHSATHIEIASNNRLARIDGGSTDTGTVDATPPTIDTFVIGARAGNPPTNPMSGRICELIVISGAISPDNETNLGTYFGRWGI